MVPPEVVPEFSVLKFVEHTVPLGDNQDENLKVQVQQVILHTDLLTTEETTVCIKPQQTQ